MDSSDDQRLGAMRFLTLALQLLDESDAPADIGAHVDAAISRLSEALGQTRSGAAWVISVTDSKIRT